MKTAFSHEDLKVYQNALQFAAEAELWTADWDGKHAICDHLPRAAGSVVENIAMASATCSAMKEKALDYALGSTLECAACLDLAACKGLMNEQNRILHKQHSLESFRMLVGLRRAWSLDRVKEEQAPYGSDVESSEAVHVADAGMGGFHHERLDVYRVALDVAVLFSSSAMSGSLASNVFRRIDVLMTSMVLNIAEGNGRFSSADQRRFVGVSHESAVKMAAKLDLCVIQNMIPANATDKCKRLLSRVAAMTSAMADDSGEL